MDASHAHLTARIPRRFRRAARDATLLGGLLIAAASAGGFSPIGVPSVEQRSAGGVSAMLLLDGAHLTLHALPDRQTLLFDIVAPASHDFRKVMDVLSRRLTAR